MQVSGRPGLAQVGTSEFVPSIEHASVFRVGRLVRIRVSFLLDMPVLRDRHTLGEGEEASASVSDEWYVGFQTYIGFSFRDLGQATYNSIIQAQTPDGDFSSRAHSRTAKKHSA